MASYDCSAVADGEKLEDDVYNIGKEYYKIIKYQSLNNIYIVNTYKIIDYYVFINNLLFYGWYVTSTKEYTVSNECISRDFWKHYEIFIYNNKSYEFNLYN